MVEKKVIVTIPCGLHIRPAGILSNTASKFQSKSEIVYKYHVINIASILNIVASGIRIGDEIIIRCDGIDEEQAIESLERVLTDYSLHQ